MNLSTTHRKGDGPGSKRSSAKKAGNTLPQSSGSGAKERGGRSRAKSGKKRKNHSAPRPPLLERTSNATTERAPCYPVKRASWKGKRRNKLEVSASGATSGRDENLSRGNEEKEGKEPKETRKPRESPKTE